MSRRTLYAPPGVTDSRGYLFSPIDFRNRLPPTYLKKKFLWENSSAKFDFSTLFMRVKIAGTVRRTSYSSIFGPLFFLPRCSPNQAVITEGRPIFIFDPMILYDFFDNWIHFIHFTVAIMIISTSYCFFFSSLFSELIFSPK